MPLSHLHSVEQLKAVAERWEDKNVVSCMKMHLVKTLKYKHPKSRLHIIQYQEKNGTAYRPIPDKYIICFTEATEGKVACWKSILPATCD